MTPPVYSWANAVSIDGAAARKLGRTQGRIAANAEDFGVTEQAGRLPALAGRGSGPCWLTLPVLQGIIAAPGREPLAKATIKPMGMPQLAEGRGLQEKYGNAKH